MVAFIWYNQNLFTKIKINICGCRNRVENKIYRRTVSNHLIGVYQWQVVTHWLHTWVCILPYIVKKILVYGSSNPYAKSKMLHEISKIFRWRKDVMGLVYVTDLHPTHYLSLAPKWCWIISTWDLFLLSLTH